MAYYHHLYRAYLHKKGHYRGLKLLGSAPGIHALESVLTEQTLDYLHPQFYK